jgi:hypothetical protein
MKLRIAVALLALSAGLTANPAWALWGGKESIDDPIDALVTIEALPLYAEIRLNGALVGTAQEIANKGLAVFGARAYIVTVSAPGHIERRLTLVSNSAMPQRVHVDLVPIRTP